MTIPQAKMVERESDPPVMLLTTVVEYKPNWEWESVPNTRLGLERIGGTYWVDDEVIQEPRGRDGKEPDPVSLNDQPVRDLGVPHGIAFEPLGLLHPQSPQEDGKGGDDTETKGETPDSP